MSELIDGIISQKCNDDDSMGARIEIRLDESLKSSANKAAAINNKTLSEYIRDLIKSDSQEVIKNATEIDLPSEIFDEFVAACESSDGPNDNMKEIFNNARNKYE